MASAVDLVLASCGKRKQPVPAKARALYTGPYFQACRRAAQAMHPNRGWLIVSALHGLVHPDTVIEPYNIKMGQPGCVGADRILEQADQLGLLDAAPVVALCGVAYHRVLRHVWPSVLTPLVGIPGSMGGQIVYMNDVLSRRGTI